MGGKTFFTHQSVNKEEKLEWAVALFYTARFKNSELYNFFKNKKANFGY